ncbi:MAG TPA: MlaA family lipoprotein, partial [Thermodesulfovibrionales bacterium]|nr:MlaA family lipoprotein [Thermodesulfovibrionales bacterium]
MKRVVFVCMMLFLIVILCNGTFADSSSVMSVPQAGVSPQEAAPAAIQVKQVEQVAPAPTEAKPAEQKLEVSEPVTSETEKEEEKIYIADPIYPWNKAMYHFNDKLYFWVLKPASKGYSTVFPEDVRIAVGNFFENVMTPIRFVSDILQ